MALQRAYYFTEAVLEQLFVAQGFSCVEMKVHERTVSNRAKDLHMHRQGHERGWGEEEAGVGGGGGETGKVSVACS